MLNFILRRLALIVPTVIGISLCAFFFVRVLPGDPILAMAGQHGVTPERYEILREQFGYNLPIWQQYFNYLGSWFDQLTMGVALTGYSMPIFWWGLLLIIFFSGYLGWTPVSGRIALTFFLRPITGFMLIDTILYGNWAAFVSALRHLILPAIVLGTIPLAVIARQTRSAMLEVLGEDYVRTARAKGLSPRRVVNVHALRNALIPVITTIGLQVGLLLGGAILTETIFSWPGIGKWMIDSISKRDYVVVQSGLLLIALIVMAVNLIVDVLYAVINPRIRVK
jgi:dipeptide transport system permease protein